MINFFSNQKQEHYYGDIVRLMLILAALIMLFGLPSINGYLNVPSVLSVSAILLLAVAAGFTSPRFIWSAYINVFITAAGFMIFDFAALQSFSQRFVHGEFFIANIVLSAILLVATYFSIKTVRGLETNKLSNKDLYI